MTTLAIYSRHVRGGLRPPVMGAPLGPMGTVTAAEVDAYRDRLDGYARGLNKDADANLVWSDRDPDAWEKETNAAAAAMGEDSPWIKSAREQIANLRALRAGKSPEQIKAEVAWLVQWKTWKNKTFDPAIFAMSGWGVRTAGQWATLEGFETQLLAKPGGGSPLGGWKYQFEALAKKPTSTPMPTSVEVEADKPKPPPPDPSAPSAAASVSSAISSIAGALPWVAGAAVAVFALQAYRGR